MYATIHLRVDHLTEQRKRHPFRRSSSAFFLGQPIIECWIRSAAAAARLPLRACVRIEAAPNLHRNELCWGGGGWVFFFSSLCLPKCIVGPAVVASGQPFPSWNEPSEGNLWKHNDWSWRGQTERRKGPAFALTLSGRLFSTHRLGTDLSFSVHTHHKCKTCRKRFFLEVMSQPNYFEIWMLGYINKVWVNNIPSTRVDLGSFIKPW